MQINHINILSIYHKKKIPFSMSSNNLYAFIFRLHVIFGKINLKKKENIF